MGNRSVRRDKGYYDPDLVDLVDGLFEGATQVKDGNIRLFPSRSRPRTTDIHCLFEFTPNDLSIWRRAAWRDAGSTIGLEKPTKIIDRLIMTFSGHYEDLKVPDNREKARLVFLHWQDTLPDKLARVRENLPPHRAKVAAEVAALPSTRRKRASSSETSPSEQGRGQPTNLSAEANGGASAPDLSPPAFADMIDRLRALQLIQACASSHAGVVIEGRPKSGKRYLARQYVSNVPTTDRVLWVDLAAYRDFAGVLGALGTCHPPLVAPIDREVPALLDWLQTAGTDLIILGLNDSNIATFRPLLHTLSRRPGPCRVVLTSSVASGGANVVEVGRLTGPEAAAILDLSGVEYDGDEIRSLAREIELSPFALRQTIARFGSYDRDQLTANLEDLHDGLIEMLPESLRPVYEVLEILNTDLELEIVAEVLDALGIDHSPARVIDELERLLLVKRISARCWRMETAGIETLVRYVDADALKGVFIRLARYYCDKVARGGQIPTKPGYQNCLHLLAACRLLQLADHDAPQRRWLKNRFASQLERQGEHARLLPLYEYETRISGDPWDTFRYGRILFVVGDWAQALDVVDYLFHELVKLQQRDGLYLSVLRLLAEILIELDQAELAVRILDVAIERAEIAELPALICTSTVSVLSWAILKYGQPEWCIALNEQILDHNFNGLTIPFSRQVSGIRTGVAHRVLGNTPASLDALKQASAFFAHEDIRAYAWAAGNLALTLDEAGDSAEAQRVLRSTLDVTAAHDLANNEALALCRHFVDHSLNERTREALDAEVERLELKESDWRHLGRRIAGSRLISHVLIDLDISLSQPFAFDIVKYELISFASPHAINSRFTQSLVRNLSDADLEGVVDEIFRLNSPERIFNQHLYNRVIVEACRNDVILTKKFIIPHVAVIEAQSDSVLCLYARCLEARREVALAERLLEQVRRKESFNYYNISANCASHSSPLRALELNDEALQHASTPQRKAQILMNKARIIYEHDMFHRFAEAKVWCDASIRAASKPRFHWPRNLLLKISLAHCSVEEVEERVIAHRRRYPIPVPALVALIEELRPGRIRTEALRVAHKLQ